MKKILTPLILILGLIGLTAAVAPGASAAVAGSQATVSGTTASSVRVETRAMHIVGFNAAVAKAHGYEIRKNARGQEYSIKIGSRFSPDSDPVVYGNCGASYMYFSAIGARSASPKYGASYASGYTVVNPTVEGEWYMYFVDNDGVGDVNNYSATNGTISWEQTGDTWHGTTGYAYGEVSTSSWVLMDDGGYCESGGPWESTTLY
jgi:hypothetical protein